MISLRRSAPCGVHSIPIRARTTSPLWLWTVMSPRRYPFRRSRSRPRSCLRSLFIDLFEHLFFGSLFLPLLLFFGRFESSLILFELAHTAFAQKFHVLFLLSLLGLLFIFFVTRRRLRVVTVRDIQRFLGLFQFFFRLTIYLDGDVALS